MDANSQQHVKNFKFSEQDYLIMSTNGGRILKLVLGGVTVIQGLQQYTQLGCGSYLMYPWVNRLQKPHHPYEPVFRDGNGLPIHGVVVNALSDIKVEEKQKSLILTIKPIHLNPQIPDFTQIYTLEHNKFTVHFKIDGKSNLPVCFGYHPYLQINHEDINHLTIETNIKRNIKLDDKTLLPVYPFVKSDIHISSHEKYDHLFQHTEHGNIFFRISKHGGHSVEIRSQDMKYWQIYTPPDGKRIAVQPMTFMGNLYALYSQQKFGKLPIEGTFTIILK